MKVFKFGGGILHSAEAVKKIPTVIGMFPGEPLIIIVSAFGKTTNALEELIYFRYKGKEAFRISLIISKNITLKFFQVFSLRRVILYIKKHRFYGMI